MIHHPTMFHFNQVALILYFSLCICLSLAPPMTSMWYIHVEVDPITPVSAIHLSFSHDSFPLSNFKVHYLHLQCLSLDLILPD